MAQNTISDELNRLIQAKADIKSALEEKGLTIGDSSTLDEFPGLIQEMEVGGGSDTSTIIDLIEGDITSLEIPYGTTKIGQSRLTRNSSLTDVSIPNTVTEIGNNALSYCGSLTNIIIPESVTSIGSNAFTGCGSLTNFTILGNPSLGGWMLQNVDNLVNLDIANVKQIPYQFVNTAPKLSTVKADSLEIIGEQNNDGPAFYRANGIHKLYLPNAKQVGYLLDQTGDGDSNVEIHLGKNVQSIYMLTSANRYSTIIIETVTPPSLMYNIVTWSNKIRNIYVPGQSVDAYKTAGGKWNNVSTYITPLAAVDYDDTTYTVTASGRDNVELYVDASLINSSVYTFDSTTQTGNHTVTVKSVDPSLGVLDEVSQEITI